MELEGNILDIIFRNEDNFYTIAKLDTEDGDITIVGTIPSINEGDHIQVKGEFTFNDKYGEQFLVEKVLFLPPKTKKSILTFLSSGIIKGIGPAMAKRIVDLFGDKTLDIMKNDIDQLLSVSGIGEKTIKKIEASLKARENSSEIIMFLQNLGISLNQALKIYKIYKDDTIEKISQNPYLLIQDVRGIGFKTADEIALNNKIAMDSPFRIESAIRFVLWEESQQNGHTYIPKDILIDLVKALISIAHEKIEEELTEIILNKDLYAKIINGEKVVYSRFLYKNENAVAGILTKKILEEVDDFISDIDGRIEKYEKDQNIELDEKQKKAIELSTKYPCLIITGGPGTGKTTIIKAILEIFEESHKKVILCAPTGRASKRMEESTNHTATTIHRLLGFRPGNENDLEFNEKNKLKADLIIVDETSMIDIQLMNLLANAIGEDTRLILVGDIDQLPSVGAGNVLRDLIFSRTIPTVRLTEIFRQAKTSNIILNAHYINAGYKPKLNEKDKDFYYIKTANSKETVKTITDLIANRLPNSYNIDKINDIQVLTPVKKGDTGTKELNMAIQEAVNPYTPHKAVITYMGTTFRVGDKVMQMKNDYNVGWELSDGSMGSGIYNGDLGRIVKIDEFEERLEILFDESRLVKIEKKSLEGISLAYATTIHKSQGSQFPVVIIPLENGPYMLYTRNLIYTGITRAQKLIILVGKDKILTQMINNNRIDKRYSGLAYQLNNIYSILKE